MSNAFLKSTKLWQKSRWCSRCCAIMTMQLNICSTLFCPAPKLASPCLGSWSSLWSCNPGIDRGFPSLLVIWSTPLATSSVPRYSDIELLVLSLFLPPNCLSVQMGCRPFKGTCLFSLLLLPFSTGGLSSLSVEDRLVCNMEPSVSSSQLYLSPQHPIHLISIPYLSVISVLSLSSMTAALC